MVEVKLYLADAYERAAFEGAVQAIEAHRAKLVQQTGGIGNTGPRVVEAEVLPVANAAPETPAAPAEVKTAEAPKTRHARTPKAEPAPAPVAEVPKAAETTPAPAAEPEAKKFTKAEIEDLTRKLAKSDFAGAKALLAKFNAGRVADLKESDYQAFGEAITALSVKGDEAASLL